MILIIITLIIIIMNIIIIIHHQSRLSTMSRSAPHWKQEIGQIRNCLDENSTLTLVHSFVTSRLDFNNGLLGNIANKDIAQLQRVQNIAARITTKARRRENISPVLKSLHWLKIDKRIYYSPSRHLTALHPTTSPNFSTTTRPHAHSVHNPSFFFRSQDSTPSSTGKEHLASLHLHSGTTSLCTFVPSRL